MVDLAVIVVAISIGSLVKGATGFGLPQLAIPVMAAFLGVERSVIIMAVAGVVSNGWLVWTHRESRGDSKHLKTIVGVGVIGAVFGTILLKSLDAQVLSLLLGLFILSYVTLMLVKPSFAISPRTARFTSPVVGFFAGGFQGATGISGPLLTTYLLALRMRGSAFVYSLSLLFLVFSTVQTGTLVSMNVYTPELVWESLLVLVPIALFLPLGSHVGRRLSPRAFQVLVLVLLTFSSLKLIHDGLT